MSLKWLSKVLRWFIGGLFTILLGWLGIELNKSKKLDETIEQQKIVIEEQKKKIEVQKAIQAIYVETVIEMEKIEREQEMVEQKIENAAENMEDTIAIANDIVSRFNAK